MIKLLESQVKKMLEKYDRASYEVFFKELYVRLLDYFYSNYPADKPTWEEFFNPLLPEDVKRDYKIGPDEYNRKRKEFVSISGPVMTLLDKKNLKGAFYEMVNQCIALYTQKQNNIQRYETQIKKDLDKIYWGVFLPTVHY